MWPEVAKSKPVYWPQKLQLVLSHLREMQHLWVAGLLSPWTFFASENLAGTFATKYGFNVTDTGISTSIFNVGSSGAAFDVADDTDRTIMRLLLATNAMTDPADQQSSFASSNDQNGDDVVDAAEAGLRTLANDIYSSINAQGSI